jgi:hypothetical protein
LWNFDGAFFEVWFKSDLHFFTCPSARSGLHSLVHEKDLAISSGIGKERSAKCEPLDSSADASALANRPRLREIEWHASDHPAETGPIRFQERGEFL